MNPLLSRSLLSLTLSLVSTATFADTVWLKNGDRITGTVRLLSGGKLLVSTSYGGNIPLAWNQVSTLETEKPLLVRQGEYGGEVSKTIQRGEDGQVVLANGGAPKVVETASIQQLIRPKPVVTDLTWTGNVDVSMDYKRADSDTDDYNIAFKTKARHGFWRHNATGEYNRETADGETVTDNYALEYALDRFLTEKWFWQGRLSFDHDNIEDLSQQTTLGTGPGHQFWDDELGAFSVAGLVNRSDYEYSNGEKDHFYSLAAKWDYNRFLVGKTVEFFTNGEVGKPIGSVADYALDAEAGLRYKVTDWASLNMRAERDIVAGAEDGELDETRYMLGFGVGW